jgi:hypothetical protein
MNATELSAWLATLSAAERITAIALIYSNLTVSARELFLPEFNQGAHKAALDKLQGLNEVHHQLAGQLVGLSSGTDKSYPIDIFSKVLYETAERYGLTRSLNSAVQFARTRDLFLKR